MPQRAGNENKNAMSVAAVAGRGLGSR